MRKRTFMYKGIRYFAFGKARTLNGGEYYVCVTDFTDAYVYLTPADSGEVHPID